MDDLFANDTTPITALRQSSIANLSKCLDGDGSLNEDTHYLNNYVGLAEMADLAPDEIKNLKNTKDLLDSWPRIWTSRGKRAPTVGDLWKILSKLGRPDVHQQIVNLVGHDVEIYKITQATTGNRCPTDETGDQSLSYKEEEFDDICLDGNGRKLYFDGFAVHKEGEDRIWPIIDLMEQLMKISIFYTPRDMPAGVAFFAAQAYIIDKRCRKTLCFITKTFNSSQSCNFIVRLQHSWNPSGGLKRLIPIVLDKDADIPMVISPISKVDFSGCSVEDFPTHMSWPCLESSMRRHPQLCPFSDPRTMARVEPLPRRDELPRRPTRRLKSLLSVPHGFVSSPSTVKPDTMRSLSVPNGPTQVISQPFSIQNTMGDTREDDVSRLHVSEECGAVGGTEPEAPTNILCGLRNINLNEHRLGLDEEMLVRRRSDQCQSRDLPDSQQENQMKDVIDDFTWV